MKNICLMLSVLFTLFSCSNWKENPKPISSEEKQEQLESRNDSLLIVFDSIMEIKIDIPQLVDSSFIAIECLDQFNTLARETNGQLKVVANSKFVAKVINEILESNLSHDADLMLIIDKTGSMKDDIHNIKKGLNQILETLSEYDNVRLSVATYGDKHYDEGLWFNFKNFETDFSSTIRFVNHIKTTGGGDFPESVYDGIHKAFEKGFWQSNSSRIVVLLGDAPSLDSTRSEHTLEDIISIATAEEINMNFYPIVLSPQDLGYTLDVPKMQNLTFIEALYPNPCRGKFTLKLNQLGSYTYELFDQSGTLLSKKQLSGDTYSDELYAYPNGLYLIRVSDENKNYDTRKLILEK